LIKKPNIKNTSRNVWINPYGGYGDILMLSGVLKQCIDTNPRLKFNLVRRTICSDLLNGHPAIKRIGHPPKKATIIDTRHYLKEKPGENLKRPYQILARLFGLKTPVREMLYLPGEFIEDGLFQDLIFEKSRKIAIIAPSSGSPRKMMNPVIWQEVVDKLKSSGIFVVQVGHKDDVYIKGAYSLLGLTTPRQLITLLLKSNVIISVDNFIMHAAHLVDKPAVIIWGPTNSAVYGYPEQIHIQCSTKHCELKSKCMGPDFPDNNALQCPVKERHCMSKITPDKIIKQILKICS
jgi:ADP-heptose:LPS heptosyltransferase